VTRPTSGSPRAGLEILTAVLRQPRVVNTIATAAIGSAVLATALHSLIGTAGLIGIISTLVALCAATLTANRDIVHWQSLVPLSLLVFLGWASLTIFFSQYQWATLWGLGYFFAYTFLGFSIALLRDTIQIVRAFGDVLRFVLVLSLALEIFSGLLIDTPITFLGIQGNLAQLGPIQGVMGTRNQFALISLVAFVTFGTELRTKSVDRWLARASLALALGGIALAQSPVIFGVFAVTVAAIAVLYGIRRVPASSRTLWQLALLVAVLIGLAVTWAARTTVIAVFNAGGDLDYRLDLWRQVWSLIGVHSLEGWGWTGYWHPGLQPFTAFSSVEFGTPTSALNAYIDVWLQLGLVGLALFVGVVGLAFTRSWLLAGRRRSSVFAWPALVLVVLIVSGLAESSVLVEWGWLAFVVCCVKAARELSWRRAFTRPNIEVPLS
jgi:O-antigen ligase